jgi:hypothetical protein
MLLVLYFICVGIYRLLLRAQVLKAVKMLKLAFCLVTPCGLTGFSSEDGGNIFPRNVYICLSVHIVLQLRRPISISFLLDGCFLGYSAASLSHRPDDGGSIDL